MRLLVPFDAREPNTRLAPLLSAVERHALAECMLADVVEAARDAGASPTVLSTGSVDCAAFEEAGVRAYPDVEADSDQPAASKLEDNNVPEAVDRG